MISFHCAAVLYAHLVLAAVSPSLAAVTAQLKEALQDDSADQNYDPSHQMISFPLVPHHMERRRRRRARGLDAREPDDDADCMIHGSNRRLGAKQVGALYQGYGTHYIDLWCGTPPQRQTVIVDTGSSVTAFPCDGCNDCGVPEYHIDGLFDTKKSDTFEVPNCKANGCTSARSHCGTNDQCNLSMAYAEGSRWSAYEGADKCYIGGSHVVPLVGDHGSDDLDPSHASHFAFDMVFGCQTTITGLFKTQLADGIMGMSNNKGTYWHQMFKSGHMGSKRQFTLCFSRQPTADRDGTEAGSMTLGGVDARLHHDDMVYTTKTDSGRSGFFSIRVRNIYLRDGKAGESARSKHHDVTQGVVRLDVTEDRINKSGIIVDSGTTDTYWNRYIASEFRKQYKQMTDKVYSNHGSKLTQAQLEALPTILFQIYGENEGANPKKTLGLVGDLDPEHPTDVLLAFPPSHYMEYDPETKTYTPRFYVTENGGSVLGANAMMGHDVLFDVDANRIGFAESDCDFSKILERNGFKSVFDTSINETMAENDDSDDDSASSDLQELLESCDSTCRGSIIGGCIAILFLVVCVSKSTRSRSTPAELYAQNIALADDFDNDSIEMADGEFEEEDETSSNRSEKQ